MRDRNLHSALESFTMDAAAALAAETANGAEVPFEVVETEGRRGSVPLYCYRPLTAGFIGERGPLLTCLPAYSSAARAIGALSGSEAYLIQRGYSRGPRDPRERADALLLEFLRRVFDERSEFEFDPGRFERAYQELELAVFEGRRQETVLTPVLGLAFDESIPEIALGDGLTLIRGDKLPEAPGEAVWGNAEEPHVLIVLTTSGEQLARSAVSVARARFRRVLTALRLFESGGYALGPLAWSRADSGTWRTVPMGGTGRPGLTTVLPARQEDELRAFCNLVGRRAPSSGEVAWALARYEMGCERLAPFEALTDYLLGLRGLLEPEGPASGRLAQRLAVLCARPEGQAAMAERTARAISLERAVIAGLASAQRSAGADQLVAEVAEHLRALLRDVVCGHLDGDLVGVADRLLAESMAAATPDTAPDGAPEPALDSDPAADPGYPVEQAAPYSAPAGVGSVMPTRHDM